MTLQYICNEINSKRFFPFKFTENNTRLVIKYLNSDSIGVIEPHTLFNQSSYTDFEKIKEQARKELFLTAIEDENLEILEDEFQDREPGYKQKIVEDHLFTKFADYGNWWFDDVSCEYNFSIHLARGNLSRGDVSKGENRSQKDQMVFIPLFTSCILGDSLDIWVEVCVV